MIRAADRCTLPLTFVSLPIPRKARAASRFPRIPDTRSFPARPPRTSGTKLQMYRGYKIFADNSNLTLLTYFAFENGVFERVTPIL